MIEKELLLKARLFEEDYDIPGVGTIRLRCLSWEECIALQAWTTEGRPAAEVYARALHLAMVDPALTEEEAAAWLRATTGDEIETLFTHIVRKAGLVEGAQKSV